MLGIPVHRFGGKTRDRVRIAAILSMKGSVESLLESADAFFERGFRHLVLKIGIDPQKDRRNAEALRNRYGNEIALRVDANAALDYDTALGLLKGLEPFDIETAEQPLAIWDMDGMAARRPVRMPLMADECAATDHALLDIIQSAPPPLPGREERRHLSHSPLVACPGDGGMGINPAITPRPAWPPRPWRRCAASAGPLMAGVLPSASAGPLQGMSSKSDASRKW